MSEPVPSDSLVSLATVLKRLNEASDELNATISEFEAVLVAMNPGISVWCSTLLRVDEPKYEHEHARGSQFGFTKVGNRWGLWIRRGNFLLDSGVWTPVEDGAWDLVKLVDASREDRTAAIEAFPALVEEMTEAARKHLMAIDRVTRRRTRC